MSQIHNQPQKLDSITFKRLKNLCAVTIDFLPNAITGIFGPNGCGKSTILHALACIYRPNSGSSRIDYKFSSFFLPTTLGTWSGNEFEVHYSMIQGKEMLSQPDAKLYKKGKDRWSPRYIRRPAREVFYIGITSCVPDMEKETRKSRLQLLEHEWADQNLINRLKSISSYVMNRPYEDIKQFEAGRKLYKGLKFAGLTYPSLYMGAGEQRILEILRIVLSAHDYSLILIDEIDLTLHTEALMRLMYKLNEIAIEKKLQIVFTSHREELLNCDYLNIRHLINDSYDGKTRLCFDRTTPNCIQRLTGKAPRILEFLVEDDLAEAMIRKVLRQKGIEVYCSVTQYGSIENSFRVGAGLILRGEELDNTLIVTDGDKYREVEDKTKMINQLITGTDNTSKAQKALLLSKIKQFNIPNGNKPEEYLTGILKTLADMASPFIPFIKNVGVVDNHHDLLNKPIDKSGMPKPVALSLLADLLSKETFWGNYVKDIADWVDERIRVNTLI